MNYLGRLRAMKARERESENFTQFTQSIKSTTSEPVRTDCKSGGDSRLEASPTNRVLRDGKVTHSDTSGSGNDFVQFLQLPTSELLVQSAQEFDQVKSEYVVEQASLSFDARHLFSQVEDDKALDALQVELIAEPQILPGEQAPDENCKNCEKFSTNANFSVKRREIGNLLRTCRTCRYVSRFGNCTEPIAAGLSDRFVLISHAHKGVRCQKFQPSVSEKTAHVLRLIDRALRIKAIDEEEAERAGDAVLRADSIDYQYVIEYESLIRACIRSTEKGERRYDS
jgi:hypothetical protein